MKFDGGCHCGKITFEAEADLEDARICHCTDCQLLSASATPDATARWRASIPAGRLAVSSAASR